MNLILANSFITFFQNLFSDWQLVLFGVLTVLLVLAIVFGKFKTALIVLLSLSGAIGVVLIVDLVIEAIKWDIYAFIDFLIAWLPTILFSLIVVLSTLVNAKRGRRKSLILLAQSASAAILWILLYYFLVRSSKIDAGFVKLVNLFMGENGLQNALNVSSEATTVREILTLYVESMSGDGLIGTLIGESSAYVYTLADMAYHIGFASLCYFFYLCTVFFLYIIYLCCYSERKYKKKKMKKLSENQTDTPYKKHHVGGAIVGLVRGVAVGLVCLSFLGAVFFVAAGRGDGKLRDMEASGKYEKPISVYQSVEKYGTQGIFLVLNAMSDPNDMPYYLFAADLVFSGALNDEKYGVSENINLRKELGSLTGFAQDTVSLLLKYGEDEIFSALNGTGETGVMQSVLNVMKKEEFRTDFDEVIGEFNAPTYVFNLSMSLVNSVLANIDDTSFGGSLSENNRELVKILFKEGHLSPSIPEDRALHDINQQNGAEDPWLATGKNVRPYLGIQQLVTKEDFRVFLDTFLTVLSERGGETSTFDLIRSIIPNLKQLSLFEEEGENAVDPVLTRLYCFVENAFLKAEGAEDASYFDLVDEDVKWTDELSALLDVADEFYSVYDDVKDAETAVFNRILYVFNRDNPNREKDVALYDSIAGKISDSRLLGKTLATSFFKKTLSDGLGQIFENFYLSDQIVYENVYGAGGVVAHGELYYFLKGLRHIGCMEDQTFLNYLFGGETEGGDSILSALAGAVEERDADGKNLSYYASSSQLLRSLVSSFLIEKGEDMIYVPNSVTERDAAGEKVNLIVSEEIEALLNGVGLISSFMDECVDGDYYAYIDKYLDDAEFMKFIEASRIAEGSLSMHIRDRIVSETDAANKQFVIPKRLEDSVENWISVNGARGELRNFIDSYHTVRNSAGVDEGGEYRLNLLDIMNGDQEELILTSISEIGKGQTEEEKKATIERLFASEIIYYTVSYYLDSTALNNLTVIVPSSAKTTLYHDSIGSVIKKEELCELFMGIGELGINDSHKTEDPQKTTDLLSRVINKRGAIRGEILSASVVANIVSNSTFYSVLRLNRESLKKYRDTGSIDYLENNYFNVNPWKAELPRLIDALEVLFADKLGIDGFTFNTGSMLQALNDKKDDPLVMQVCRLSEIIGTGYEDELNMLESGTL